jgi:rubrerythrin
MDIFEYAMNVEKDGEALYRELATDAPNTELWQIFEWLADAELRHYQIFKRMEDEKRVVVQETPLLQDVVNIFEQIKIDEKEIETMPANAYRKAKEIEEKMITFYLAKAAETDDPNEKAIFTKVADEEKRHAHVLENLINFANNPEVWIKEDRFKEILTGFAL